MYRLDVLAKKLARLSRDERAEYEGQHAAVAAILRENGGGEAELLFIRRAEHAGDPWSGHIAFPGGRKDPGDATLLSTAVRETKEEVGIDLAGAELLGRLPDLPAFTRSKRQSFVVATFVFAVRGDVSLTANHEVAETFWLPLAMLAGDEGRGVYDFTYDGKAYQLPCIRFGEAQHVLWGLTHRMVESMLEELSKNSVL
jgi:8-oxo-dGTP pyrophosphatase MutT (NUDIX family)